MSYIVLLLLLLSVCVCLCFHFPFTNGKMVSSPPINKVEDGPWVEIYVDAWVVFTYKKVLGCLFRLVKEFDKEVKDLESRNDPGTNKMLNEKKQSMVGYYLNLYFAFGFVTFSKFLLCPFVLNDVHTLCRSKSWIHMLLLKSSKLTSVKIFHYSVLKRLKQFHISKMHLMCHILYLLQCSFLLLGFLCFLRFLKHVT
jgi:hypothetical protein